MTVQPLKQSGAPDTIECINPATGQVLGTVPVDSADDVQVAVARAREAQKQWRHSSWDERRRLLQHIMDHLLAHSDELCRVVVQDSGKTMENAIAGEIWPVCEKLRWTIRNGEKYLKTENVWTPLFPHKRAMIEYHPLGVIGVICPWNYPLQNIMGPTIPALMAGNGVVVKVSEAVAWSSARFLRIFQEALESIGYPSDLVQIVNGYGETGAALVRSGVELIVFTGSMPNGRRIIEGSAENITPVILELGGKDPMIICDDADLDQAVHAALGGVFINCGQNCLAAERLLVFDGIYDRFTEAVAGYVNNFRQGPPLGGEPVDVGAIVSPIQIDLVERLVNDAVSKGARVLAGGKRTLTDQGQYFQPTILADVTDDMDITREETFGPVMCIRRVSGEEEAIQIANGADYGLSSTVFTTDKDRARRLANQLEAGSTCINDFGFTYMAMGLPFGGVKGSGFGRLNGAEGLRACTNRKAVLEDRIALHKPIRIYPVTPHDYDIAKRTIQMIYRRGILGRIGNLFGLIGLQLRKATGR